MLKTANYSESEINVKVESANVHLSNFGYSMQIFQVRPVSPFLASFFLEFLDFFASLGFFISWPLYPIK